MMEDSATPVKRGRGRPKGSKNKPKGVEVPQVQKENPTTPAPVDTITDEELDVRYPRVDKVEGEWEAVSLEGFESNYYYPYLPPETKQKLKTNLQIGDRCRIQPNGPIYTVIRKSPGALYMRSGEGEASRLEAFAVNSFVYGLEEGE